MLGCQHEDLHEEPQITIHERTCIVDVTLRVGNSIPLGYREADQDPRADKLQSGHWKCSGLSRVLMYTSLPRVVRLLLRCTPLLVSQTPQIHATRSPHLVART